VWGVVEVQRAGAGCRGKKKEAGGGVSELDLVVQGLLIDQWGGSTARRATGGNEGGVELTQCEGGRGVGGGRGLGRGP